MSPQIERVLRQCYYCGKVTDQVHSKTVKVYPSPHDYRQSTYIFTHEFKCMKCGITTKDK